jgi:hypothetical protein
MAATAGALTPTGALSEAGRSRIAEENALDVELYNFARSLFEVMVTVAVAATVTTTATATVAATATSAAAATATRRR